MPLPYRWWKRLRGRGCREYMAGNTDLVEVHGFAVAQDVRAELGIGELWVARSSLVFVKDPCDAAAAEFEPVLVEKQRLLVNAYAVEVVFGEVGSQQHRRVLGQRDMAGFAAFSGESNQSRTFQLVVADGQISEFRDSDCGVIQDGQQLCFVKLK